MYADWEFVLWGILLLAVVLWNLLMQALRRKRVEQARQAPDGATSGRPTASDLPWPAGAERVPEPWGRAPARQPDEGAGQPPVRSIVRTVDEEFLSPHAIIPNPVPVAAPDRPLVQRTRAATRWRNRADVRRAFMDIAVLGPPRSLAPYEPSGGTEPPAR
jgi:hypothetical protein